MSAPTPLVLAVPSKGRLQENANAFFARAGLDVVQARGARDYRGALAQLPGVEIAFLSASEIVSQLAAGTAHLGVTGEDLVRESVADADSKLDMLTPLGFGYANVVVAVPQAWIDVTTLADLEDVAAAFHARHGARMRVATKYVNITRKAFSAYGVTDYRIVESLGATEGAPAAGQAELIVDITTTGATLQANALKVLEDGVLLRSQANLVASLKADWSPHAREMARQILSRITAEETARTTRQLRAPGLTLDAALVRQIAEKFSAIVLASAELEISAPLKNVASLADWLLAKGAARVSVFQAENVFSAEKKLLARLIDRIGK